MFLNQEDKGVFFLLLAPDNDVWIKRSDLNGIGLQEGLGEDIRVKQDIYVPLGSIPDLSFHIDEKDVSLNISADPSLFNKKSIDSSYGTPHEIIYPQNNAAFLNYALFYTAGTTETTLDVSGELGISTGDYLGLTTFTYTDADDSEDFTSLMTNITYNDRENLRTVIMGDFTALSGILGSVQLLGGINFTKNFSIDPYLLYYPPLNLSGVLETPSDVEVYLDGMFMKEERLSPGEFQFTDVPATVGLGTANIVITDAFGRERTISTPYYYTNRLLKKGLHEYSYSIGFQREDFGEKNFSYSGPAFLGYHSLGLTNNLKAGYGAEISEELINIGPTASVLIARAGTLDGAVAFSESDGESGLSAFLGYSFKTRNINVFASIRRNSREYANLAHTPEDDKARLEFSGAVGFNSKEAGSISVGYSSLDMYEEVDTSKAFISYNKALTKNTTFFVIASKIEDDTTDNQLFLGLHIYFGRGITGSMSYTGKNDDDQSSVRLQKNLPTGTGLGFKVEAEDFHDKSDFEGILQYQNSYGIYEAGYYSRDDENTYRLSAAGGIGYIDRSVFFSRPVNDSFAKVKVDGLEGVRVYHFGNEIGRTDGNGNVILPNLLSFHNNRIDIEGNDIPIDYAFPQLTKRISPPYRSGSLVEFAVNKIQAITGTVFIAEKDGKMPVDSAVMRIQTEGSIMEGLIGRNGKFYLENIPPGKHAATISHMGGECTFDLVIPVSDAMFIDIGEVVCE